MSERSGVQKWIRWSEMESVASCGRSLVHKWEQRRKCRGGIGKGYGSGLSRKMIGKKWGLLVYPRATRTA